MQANWAYAGQILMLLHWRPQSTKASDKGQWKVKAFARNINKQRKFAENLL